MKLDFLFFEVIATCSIPLSTSTCNLLGFVPGLLLPCLPIGYFVDLKITLFEGLFQHSTLLLMVVANSVAISFLAIREMSLLSELFQWSSWGIVLGPPSPPPPLILLIPFDKSCFVEPYVLNLRHVVV